MAMSLPGERSFVTESPLSISHPSGYSNVYGAPASSNRPSASEVGDAEFETSSADRPRIRTKTTTSSTTNATTTSAFQMENDCLRSDHSLIILLFRGTS
jgi:hypothetical protein